MNVAAAGLAPNMPEGMVRGLERMIAAVGGRLPVLARIVEENLRSAGVFSRAVQRAYFAEVGLHYANGLRIFRDAARSGAVARLARDRVDLDASIDALPHQLAQSGGLVICPPHVCNYLQTLVRLNQVIPLSVYLRWSRDPRKRRLKQRWCEAAGLQVILEPPNVADPAARAMACVEAVRAGRALVMTPDLAQKSDQGLPVTLLGRRVYLPAGPASIAMLAGVPLAPVFGRLAGRRHQIYACEPLRVPMLKREDGGRHAALQGATQCWVECFERYLRECPSALVFLGR